MGGDLIASQDEDSGLEEDFSLISSDSPTFPRDNLSLKVDDGRVNGVSELVFGETVEYNRGPSILEFELIHKRRPSAHQEILQNYDELKIRSKDLKEAKEKILSYYPGAWTERVGGLKLSDYDIPKTTCLLLVGPRGSGKSSLVNRISKVFEDDKFIPARAQVSYNSPTGDETYFLQEYTIPRSSAAICLYDTRSLSENSHDNERMLYSWMAKGVRHGELVVRNTDNQSLKKSLNYKACKSGYLSSKIRKVNFVIYVVNGLSVLKAMERTGDLETKYTETIASTFNCPCLSFKDDKPVLVVTHGDLLSLSDRASVRAYLGKLLGIPPTRQIFDIPERNDPVTEFTIIEMLRYTLEHADKNYPHKNKVMDKVHKAGLSLFLILLILGLGVAIAFAHHNFIQPRDGPQSQASSGNKHASRAKLKSQTSGGNKHASRPKLKAPIKEPKVDWYKIRHIW